MRNYQLSTVVVNNSLLVLLALQAGASVADFFGEILIIFVLTYFEKVF